MTSLNYEVVLISGSLNTEILLYIFNLSVLVHHTLYIIVKCTCNCILLYLTQMTKENSSCFNS